MTGRPRGGFNAARRASFYAGCFEELTPEQFDRQLATNAGTEFALRSMADADDTLERFH